MQPLQKYSECFEFSDDSVQTQRAIVQLLFCSINYYYIYCIFYVIRTITVLLFIMPLTWNYFNIVIPLPCAISAYPLFSMARYSAFRFALCNSSSRSEILLPHSYFLFAVLISYHHWRPCQNNVLYFSVNNFYPNTILYNLWHRTKALQRRAWLYHWDRFSRKSIRWLYPQALLLPELWGAWVLDCLICTSTSLISPLY